MQEVYSSAICCIVATAAKDSDGGLFNKREPQELTSIKVLLQTNVPSDVLRCSSWADIFTAIDYVPLNQRAWVSQERYLSTRVMHCSRVLLFWECLETFASETHPESIPIRYRHAPAIPPSLPSLREVVAKYQYQKLRSDTSDIYGKRAQSNDSPMVTSVDVLHAWHQFRLDYSKCKTTKESDGLIAVQGIAKTVAEALDDKILFGHFKCHFL